MRPTSIEAAKRIRSSLLNGSTPTSFRTALAAIPPDDRDAWLDYLWDLDELPEDDPQLPCGCVPYLPCPATTVLEAVQEASVTDDDVFVDVGSGLGRTAALAHLLTGAGCIGLEIQPQLVQAARARAAWLNLSRVRFVEGDAADLINLMTIGTVFFLYCPFSGERLARVMSELEGIARIRQIRICSVALPHLDHSWLEQVPSTAVDFTVYRSKPPRTACP